MITAAYSMDRWPMTCAAVRSALAQTIVPREIILPIDHNPELFDRLSEWASGLAEEGARSRVVVVESKYEGHLSASATTAAELAQGEFLAFLDDDAVAASDWLAHLLAPFSDDEAVIAVGGAPLPVYSRPRPRWFPPEFDWVFGCAYVGLPEQREPILHLIGTTMAVRREHFLAIGGVHSDDHGDMELSHRLMQLAPGSKLIYEPTAVVHHFVHESRLTWSYFWRRCFFANRRKVSTMRRLGPAANLTAEREFATRTLSRGILKGLGQGLRGDLGGILRAASICAGLGLSIAGYSLGSIEWHVSRRRT